MVCDQSIFLLGYFLLLTHKNGVLLHFILQFNLRVFGGYVFMQKQKLDGNTKNLEEKNMEMFILGGGSKVAVLTKGKYENN